MTDDQVRALIEAMDACTGAIIEAMASERPDASKIKGRLWDGIKDAKANLE